VSKTTKSASKWLGVNIRANGRFCVSTVEFGAQNATNANSGTLEKDVDEFDVAASEKVLCEGIAHGHVAPTPAAIECRLQPFASLTGEHNVLVVGAVVSVNIRDGCSESGRFDVATLQPHTRIVATRAYSG
jgi:flavin reductase (DIM6/NTAB) family NADH-FMN oxidoreductase RutF